MSDLPPQEPPVEHLEINALAPTPAPQPAAVVTHTPDDAPQTTPQDAVIQPLTLDTQPDDTPKVMVLGGRQWPCIDEIPAGRMADIIQQQLDLNDAAESNDPTQQARAVTMMLGLFEHFVEDQHLPDLNQAMRDKANPIGLRDAISKANEMIRIYMRGDDSGK